MEEALVLHLHPFELLSFTYVRQWEIKNHDMLLSTRHQQSSPWKQCRELPVELFSGHTWVCPPIFFQINIWQSCSTEHFHKLLPFHTFCSVAYSIFGLGIHEEKNWPRMLLCISGEGIVQIRNLGLTQKMYKPEIMVPSPPPQVLKAPLFFHSNIRHGIPSWMSSAAEILLKSNTWGL